MTLQQENELLYDIKGRVIVVTGACGLLGRSMTYAFHKRGAHLILADIPEAEPEKFANALGGETVGLSFNVADSKSVASMVSKAKQYFKR